MRFTPIGPFSSWKGVTEGRRSAPDLGGLADARAGCGKRQAAASSSGGSGGQRLQHPVGTVALRGHGGTTMEMAAWV